MNDLIYGEFVASSTTQGENNITVLDYSHTLGRELHLFSSKSTELQPVHINPHNQSKVQHPVKPSRPISTSLPNVEEDHAITLIEKKKRQLLH
jgi:hypothetical protein